MIRKPVKPKMCICGAPFIPKGIQNKCNKCKAKIAKGGHDMPADDLKLLSLPDLKLMAKGVLHEYVRLRDKDEGCISCFRPAGDKSVQWQAGHLFKAELFSGVELDEENICRQCLPCNYTPDGSFEDFRRGYKARYGNLALELLEARAVALRSYKYDRLELIGIIEKYRELTIKLKAA